VLLNLYGKADKNQIDKNHLEATIRGDGAKVAETQWQAIRTAMPVAAFNLKAANVDVMAAKAALTGVFAVQQVHQMAVYVLRVVVVVLVIVLMINHHTLAT
jgi:hypothetical protein